MIDVAHIFKTKFTLTFFLLRVPIILELTPDEYLSKVFKVDVLKAPESFRVFGGYLVCVLTHRSVSCHVLLSLWMGLLCNADTIAYRDEKFFLILHAWSTGAKNGVLRTHQDQKRKKNLILRNNNDDDRLSWILTSATLIHFSRRRVLCWVFSSVFHRHEAVTALAR